MHIVITGPESTGKTTLTENLAKRFKCDWVPEYARKYIENLGRRYDYGDVENIARHQIQQIRKHQKGREELIFFDTHLLITKFWFEIVFNKLPKWFLDEYYVLKPDFFLLLTPEVEWIYDAVRENPGEKRNELFEIYKNEIQKLNIPYDIVYGKQFNERTENAIKIIQKFVMSFKL